LILPNSELRNKSQSQKYRVFHSLGLLDKEKALKKAIPLLYETFCWNSVLQKRYTGTPPACSIPECDSKHIKKLHELLTNSPTLITMLECQEDDEKEG
jgi:hypothetical protein